MFTVNGYTAELKLAAHDLNNLNLASNKQKTKVCKKLKMLTNLSEFSNADIQVEWANNLIPLLREEDKVLQRYVIGIVRNLAQSRKLAENFFEYSNTIVDVLLTTLTTEDDKLILKSLAALTYLSRISDAIKSTLYASDYLDNVFALILRENATIINHALLLIGSLIHPYKDRYQKLPNLFSGMYIYNLFGIHTAKIHQSIVEKLFFHVISALMRDKQCNTIFASLVLQWLLGRYQPDINTFTIKGFVVLDWVRLLNISSVNIVQYAVQNIDIILEAKALSDLTLLSENLINLVDLLESDIESAQSCAVKILDTLIESKYITPAKLLDHRPIEFWIDLFLKSSPCTVLLAIQVIAYCITEDDKISNEVFDAVVLKLLDYTLDGNYRVVDKTLDIIRGMVGQNHPKKHLILTRAQNYPRVAEIISHEDTFTSNEAPSQQQVLRSELPKNETKNTETEDQVTHPAEQSQSSIFIAVTRTTPIIAEELSLAPNQATASAAGEQQVESRSSSNVTLNLEDKFAILMSERLLELYFENYLRKTVLPEREYLHLAEKLILKVKLSLSAEIRKFALFTAIFSFLSKDERSAYINDINASLLPKEWQEDVVLWRFASQKNVELAEYRSNDIFLASWRELLLGNNFSGKSPMNIEKRLECYENALRMNSKNLRAIFNLYYELLDPKNPCFDLSKTEVLIQTSLNLFVDHPIISLRLQSALASIYVMQWADATDLLEKHTCQQKITELGFDSNEPYFVKIRSSWIYNVRGVDAGRNAWYYVDVRPSQVKAFKTALNDKIIHLENYGSILSSAYGDNPPPHITKNLEKNRYLDIEIPFCNKLQALLEKDYARKQLFIEENLLTLSNVLGEGKFAKVYKAILAPDNEEVAVKRYESIYDIPEKLIEAVDHELTIMQGFKSDYLVKLTGHNLHAHPPFIVLECGNRGSLYHFLHSRKKIDWSLRLRIAHDIARGLAYLHEHQYVHRDIKSLNVILFDDYRAKLSDFGLSAIKIHSSSMMSHDASASSSTKVGSLLWMAPELFLRSSGGPSMKSDIWALGMVLFEIASGLLPFAEATNEDVVKEWIKSGSGEDIPKDCAAGTPYEGFGVLMKSCWAERNNRPTAHEIVQHSIFND